MRRIKTDTRTNSKCEGTLYKFLKHLPSRQHTSAHQCVIDVVVAPAHSLCANANGKEMVAGESLEWILTPLYSECGTGQPLKQQLLLGLAVAGPKFRVWGLGFRLDLILITLYSECGTGQPLKQQPSLGLAVAGPNYSCSPPPP